MNIHFTDTLLFEQLKDATLAKVRIGSHMYGNNNENSDEDFLYIYATSEEELNSVIHTNHQLQYKEKGIDHNFVSLHTFIRNIINGDSTINYEVVQSGSLLDTDLKWLDLMKDYFNTYTIKRSYNGFARRDCKHFNKAKTPYEMKKRLGHIIRGYIYSDWIDKKFDFIEANKTFIDTINTLENTNNINLQSVLDWTDVINDQRKALNMAYEDKTLGLAKNMDVKNAIDLNHNVNIFMRSEIFKRKQASFSLCDMELFINAFENWVSYD